MTFSRKIETTKDLATDGLWTHSASNSIGRIPESEVWAIAAGKRGRIWVYSIAVISKM